MLMYKMLVKSFENSNMWENTWVSQKFAKFW